MPISNVISGLNDVASFLTETQQRVNRDVQQYTGLPIPSQQSGTIVNRKAIIWQVTGLPSTLQIPDLIMKINPKNLSSKYTQLINRKRTLAGFIEEHWGEQLDSLSAGGQTGQFFGPIGLTDDRRRDTDAYDRFRQLVAIYRNNGSVYDTRTGKIIAQGAVVMNYDNCVYAGYFESFTIIDSADRPFSLNYDFAFKVVREIYPGRIKSFANVTTVPRVGAPRNDRVTMDITTFSGGNEA